MDARSGTPAAILRLLRDGPQQAQEIAELLEIDTSAARRHLEAMRAEGLVEAHETSEGQGRPKKRYALTAAGHETFPRAYAELLALLLARVESAEGRVQLDAHLAAIARDLAAPARAAQPEERLARLLEIYNRLGFEARVEETPQGWRLVQRNCAFLRAARQQPHAMCEAFDEGIIRSALPGAKPRLACSLATGAAECRHEIEMPKAARKPK